MRIYTKNGDEGFSCVYSGERVSKASAVFDILGQIDAINSSIGYLKCCLKQNRTSYQTCGTFLELLQQELIVISSDLATFGGPRKKRTAYQPLTEKIEAQIDWLTLELPPLTTFIHPGGNLGACAAHQARVATRKLERDLVRFRGNVSTITDEHLAYFNRLSDYFFQLARYADQNTSTRKLDIFISTFVISLWLFVATYLIMYRE